MHVLRNEPLYLQSYLKGAHICIHSYYISNTVVHAHRFSLRMDLLNPKVYNRAPLWHTDIFPAVMTHYKLHGIVQHSHGLFLVHCFAWPACRVGLCVLLLLPCAHTDSGRGWSVYGLFCAAALLVVWAGKWGEAGAFSSVGLWEGLR